VKKIPVIHIDLNAPPGERWRHLPKYLLRAGRTLANRAATEIGDERLRRLAEWILDAATVARNPYKAEIAALAKIIGVPRRTALTANFSYEINQVAQLGIDVWEEHAPKLAGVWERMKGVHTSTVQRLLGCTAGAAYYPKLGMVHVRAMDWALDGLGRHTVIWHCVGSDVGDYFSIGWPGYVGVLSGMAPGRFSATINQAFPFGLPSLQWPPSHLLRHVFETSPDFDDALATLHGTPVCFPAFIMLVGVKPGQAAVVELTPAGNRIHKMTRRRPIAIANDYLTGEWRDKFGQSKQTLKPYEKGEWSEHRRNRMLTELNRRRPNAIERALAAIQTDWIDNESTMQQMVFIPATGECLVIGLEDEEPVAIGGTEAVLQM
jgi:hypothetical protein